MVEGLTVSPTLPLDLERKIFERTALSRPVCIPNLMRVAWRVQHWVEPLLYRTLVVGPADTIDGIPPCTFERFAHIANTKSASFLHDSVRNLIIVPIPVDDIKVALSVFTGVYTAVRSMALRHFYCIFRNFGVESFTYTFTHLTHLELLNGSDDDDPDRAPWASLTRLTNLTYLVIDTSNVLSVCPYLLEAWAFCDCWARADAFIAKRIPREIDRHAFWLSDEDCVEIKTCAL
ncbi:hypothetical protein DFH09DRAFT_1181010 [Mycena vulgaris]|nr:hypothetical protein DFH09DRAFT_1181010 [Mycena vulgaris]